MWERSMWERRPRRDAAFKQAQSLNQGRIAARAQLQQPPEQAGRSALNRKAASASFPGGIRPGGLGPSFFLPG